MHIKWVAVWLEMVLDRFRNEMRIQNHTPTIHQV
jgi:hypothetical protein